jgi:N-acetylglucosaminyldiphosphoundecaprenol N-acetyl-beta-D-mannosaminyltransferase
LPDRLDLLGAPLDPVTLDEAVAFVDGLIEKGTTGQQASLNAAKVVRVQRDAEFTTALRSCELVMADGVPIVWAGRLLGHSIPERVSGIDLMAALLAHAADRSHRVFLLGARADVIEDAAAEIERRYPGIQIAGRHHGYYTPEEEPDVIAEIEAARPHLLFVAFETPQKELFLSRMRGVLPVPFVMGVGGSFDVLAGRRRRAPLWMQRIGFEWFFRFVQEPRRLWRRYLIGNTMFLVLVCRELVHSRIRPGSRREASS